MNNKKDLNRENSLKTLGTYLSQGFRIIFRNIKNIIGAICCCASAALILIFRNTIFGIEADTVLSRLNSVLLGAVLLVSFVAALIAGVLLAGTPKGANSISDALRRIGLVNSAGETPILLRRYSDTIRPHIEVMQFQANGIPLSRWDDAKEAIETALNLNVVSISLGADKQTVLLATVPASGSLPKSLQWSPSVAPRSNSVLIMGESLNGPVEVDLSIIPHILIGGSTGSGKSVLLKSLLCQLIEKRAEVCIADFKGGVDFSAWERVATVVIDMESLLPVLEDIVKELEARKLFFKMSGIKNIEEMNRIETIMPRIVFACDELAQLLDKRGLNKNQRDTVLRIEQHLSTIARMGRAFGIHLILATQRPDADVLTGQIRNNIDCRACGRADDVLSRIILDTTDASDLVPKDIPGRFLLNNGTLFQAYWRDDKEFVSNFINDYSLTAEERKEHDNQ